MNSLDETLGQLNHPAILVLFCILIFIAVIAQWMLYNKAGQPGYACLIPVWNVIVFLKIVGRPASHIFFFLIPLYNIYFVIKIYIELCDSFGKHTVTDYVLCIIFNGFYVFNLGLSASVEYEGPAYTKKMEKKNGGGKTAVAS